MLRLILITVFFIFFYSESWSSPSDSLQILYQTQKFREILTTAVKNYKDSVNIKKVSEAAYSAMLKSLDQFSEYYNEQVFNNFKNNFFAEQRTSGMTLLSFDDTLIVYNVKSGSPADSSGILPGDKLIYLKGSSALKLSPAQAYSKINTSSAPVNLVFKRNNSSSLFEYSILPVQMKVNSIDTYFLLPGTDIAYIKSLRISEEAGDEFHDVLVKMLNSGAKKFILDLRSNLGGSVEQAVNVVDEFVSGENLIVDIKGNNNHFSKKFFSKSGQAAESQPLVILVDQNTISAAEIIVGALQDLDRAIIAGSVTYGKGMAQRNFEFADSTAFKLTIGDYFTASGRNIQKQQNKDIEIDPALKFNLSEKSYKDVESIIKRTDGKASLPVYKTLKGRDVIGGGGIYPDVFIENDTTTKLSQYIISGGIITQFVINNYLPLREKFYEKYKNLNDFITNHYVNDEILKHLENFSRSKKIWNDTMFVKDKEYIRNNIKSTVGYFLWGNNGFWQNDIKLDKMVTSAIKLFTEAEKLITQ